jgi:hypothetical protein
MPVSRCCCRVSLILLFTVLLPYKTAFPTENKYEWVFVYYMSYDNNLEKFGPKILEDLEVGMVSSKTAVVVQADFQDPGGMRRISLRYVNGMVQKEEMLLESEDSASLDELQQYLQWVWERYKSKNYVVVFLDHGGKLDQMCADERPYKNPQASNHTNQTKWLSGFETGKAVREFNLKTDKRVQLVFIQQCGRGSIENLYNFVDGGEYIMVSPVPVGAPNTYYTEMLFLTAQSTELDGRSIARKIMFEDRDCALYTLVLNSELKKMPGKLEPLLKAFRSGRKLNRPKLYGEIYSYDDEKCFDLRWYLEALSSANEDIAKEGLEMFFEWLEKDLIVRKGIKPRYLSSRTNYCGLSIHGPMNKEQAERYNFLPLYQQTNLDEVMSLMFE